MMFEGLGRHFAEERNGATAFTCRKIVDNGRLVNIVTDSSCAVGVVGVLFDACVLFDEGFGLGHD